MIVFTQSIVKIKTFPKFKSEKFIVITKTKKHWFKPNETFKVISRTFCDDITIDDFLKYQKHLYIDNDVVYYKPHYCLTLSNGEDMEKFFETIEELKISVEELKKLSPNIEL